MINSHVIYVFLLVVSCNAKEFINLGFEDIRTNNLQVIPESEDGFIGKSVDVIPGWTAYYENKPMDYLFFNYLPAGPGDEVIVVSRSLMQSERPSSIIEGNFALYCSPLNFSRISQTATIPSEAAWISMNVFERNGYSLSARFLINGVEIGNNVSKFAGTEVELSVILPMQRGPFNELGFYVIDEIKFSVPELNTSFYILMGIICYTIYYWLKPIPKRPNGPPEYSPRAEAARPMPWVGGW